MPIFSTDSVPKGLKIWFFVNGILDIFFGIPLLIAPKWVLFFFGTITSADQINTLELISTQLVGAALLSMGCTSLLMKKRSRDAFAILLNLKIVWSAVAMTAFAVACIETGQLALLIYIGIFLVFASAWSYYKFYKGII